MSRRRLAFLLLLAIASPASSFGAEAVADDAYLAAERLLGATEWTEAADFFGAFVRRFPEDPRVGDARFYRSEALFRAGKLDEALTEFNTIADDPRARFRAANILYLLGRSSDATAALQSLLAERKKGRRLPTELDGPARYFLARALLARGDREGARKVLEESHGRRAGSGVYVKLALGDIEAGEEGSEHADRALLMYREALALVDDPGLAAEVHFRIGELLRRIGKGKDAAESYARASEANGSGPLAPYARFGAACARLQTGDATGAIEQASVALELAQRTGGTDAGLDIKLIEEITYVRGTAELVVGEYGRAAELLASVSARGPSAVPRDRLFERLAWSAIFSGKAELALSAATELLAMEPSASRAAVAHLVAAEANMLLGRPEQALESFALSMAGEGEAIPLAVFGRGKALAALGKPLEAARAFDDFAGEHEGHVLIPAARALSARAYLAAGDAGLAADRFGEARASYAGTALEPEVLWGASLAEYMRGDFSAMAALDRQIIEEFPDSARATDAAYWLAWSRLEAKDLQGAAEAFRDVARRAADNPRLAAAALLEAAAALERAGDDKGALDIALSLITGGAAAHVPIDAVLWTADALGLQGQTDRAIEVLNAALGRAGDEAPSVLYAHAELLRSSGKLDEAIPFYDQVIGTSPTGELAAAARLGKARCLVANGRLAEAEVLLENALDRTTGWARAAAYCELGQLRLGAAESLAGEKRRRLAERAAEDFMFVVLLYEPEGPGEGADLAARALLGAARALVLLERYAPARDRLEQLITHPLYGALPEAREARKILQQIPVDAMGVGE